MVLFRILCLIVSFSSLLIGDLIKPYNNQVISYRHILFEWEQQPDAVQYQIQLSNSNSFENNPNLLLDIQTSNLVYIYKDDIDWDNIYFWRVRDIYEDNSYGSWTLPFSFVIDEKKYAPLSSDNLSINIIDESLIDDQLIALGDLSAGLFLTSFIFDKTGQEIWNGNLMVSHINEYGQLFGYSYDNFPNQSGIKTNYNNDILWNGPNGIYIDLHEVKSIPNGNYMGFVWEFQDGPIPIGDWTNYFRLLGYAADGVTNEFDWFGQAIVEWDQDSNEIWRWSPFDHFTMNDYDAYGGTWWNAAFDDNGYDWMHSNAFHFDQEESAIYFSSRHLSRITKIDYPSGEIIWMIGLPNDFEGSESEHICTDLGITWQHNVQLLENGNILLFNNGNLSQLFEFGEPTTTAIEFKVMDNSTCEVVWEYVLPNHLYGPWMGSVQKLDNNNYFINTVGSGGHAIEVDENQNIVLDAEYMLSDVPTDPAGNYRSYKVPSIHPNAYSVIFEDYITENMDEGIYFTDSINILISNESGYNQHYNYHLFDSQGWFVDSPASIVVEPYSTIELSFIPSSINASTSNLTFNIVPIHHDYDSKSYNFEIYSPQMTGDLNFDGVLNILDIVILVEIILNNNDSNFASDVNGDGIVNILDIIALLNLILE